MRKFDEVLAIVNAELGKSKYLPVAKNGSVVLIRFPDPDHVGVRFDEMVHTLDLFRRGLIAEGDKAGADSLRVIVLDSGSEHDIMVAGLSIFGTLVLTFVNHWLAKSIATEDEFDRAVKDGQGLEILANLNVPEADKEALLARARTLIAARRRSRFEFSVITDSTILDGEAPARLTQLALTSSTVRRNADGRV